MNVTHSMQSAEPFVLRRRGTAEHVVVPTGHTYQETDIRWVRGSKFKVAQASEEDYIQAMDRQCASLREAGYAGEIRFVRICLSPAFTFDETRSIAVSIADGMTWETFRRGVLDLILQSFPDKSDIRDIALTNQPLWTPYESCALDMTVGTPASELQHNSEWYVGLVSREPGIWSMTAFGLKLCSAGCGKTSFDRLRRCSGCRKAQYCGKDCQHKDWAVHKKVCKAAARR